MIDNFKLIEKGGLIAIFTLNFNGVIKVNKCRLIRDKHSKYYVSGPQEEYEKDGKKQYYSLVVLNKQLQEKVLNDCLTEYKNNGE